jgi:membrane protease YdiL (CAAX protease family)
LNTIPPYPPDDDPVDALDAPEPLDDTPDDDTPDAEADPRRLVAYRGASNDPTFGYLIAVALSLGLTPLIPNSTDMRYTLVWMVLAGFGVLAWLLGTSARIDRETPENLAWGIIFGLIISTPLLIVGGGTLATTSALLFRADMGGEVRRLTPGVVLALLVFVQPLAETLFFRGVLQEQRPFWLVGLLASLWSILLFFPMLDIGGLPVVAVVIGTALVMMNLMYSYVRQRNGLAAAWLCQIVVNVALLFLPFMTG